MARKSFVKEMRRWKKRSDANEARNLERVVVNANDHVVTPARIPIPRLQAVSVSLEDHGLVVTGQRTRTRRDEGGSEGANANLRASFRRSFTPRAES